MFFLQVTKNLSFSYSLRHGKHFRASTVLHIRAIGLALVWAHIRAIGFELDKFNVSKSYDILLIFKFICLPLKKVVLFKLTSSFK